MAVAAINKAQTMRIMWQRQALGSSIITNKQGCPYTIGRLLASWFTTKLKRKVNKTI